MKQFILSLVILLSVPTVSSTMDWGDVKSGVSTVATTLVVDNPFIAQQPEINAPTAIETFGRSEFHKAVVTAIIKARRDGNLTTRQAMTLRVALLSPAYREQAENLAVTQMAFSGLDPALPMTSDGKIDRAAIDWQGLTLFMEQFIPFLLQLLQLFGIS